MLLFDIYHDGRYLVTIAARDCTEALFIMHVARGVCMSALEARLVG